MANDPSTSGPKAGDPVATPTPAAANRPRQPDFVEQPPAPKGSKRTRQPQSFGAPELSQADIDAGVTAEVVDHAAETAHTFLNTPDPKQGVAVEAPTGTLLTGVDQALVRLKDGGTELVGKGQSLPDAAEPAAVDRLRKLGYLTTA